MVRPCRKKDKEKQCRMRQNKLNFQIWDVENVMSITMKSSIVRHIHPNTAGKGVHQHDCVIRQPKESSCTSMPHLQQHPGRQSKEENNIQLFATINMLLTQHMPKIFTLTDVWELQHLAPFLTLTLSVSSSSCTGYTITKQWIKKEQNKHPVKSC